MAEAPEEPKDEAAEAKRSSWVWITGQLTQTFDWPLRSALCIVQRSARTKYCSQSQVEDPAEKIHSGNKLWLTFIRRLDPTNFCLWLVSSLQPWPLMVLSRHWWFLQLKSGWANHSDTWLGPINLSSYCGYCPHGQLGRWYWNGTLSISIVFFRFRLWALPAGKVWRVSQKKKIVRWYLAWSQSSTRMAIEESYSY